MAEVEMRVDQVVLDPIVNAPMLILRESKGNRCMPIWVGQIEAMAILSQLKQVSMARPMTHDLMKELLVQLEAAVSKVTVTDLREGTFFAEISLRTRDGEVRIDSRPSDAIALALRSNSPIFVKEVVMARAVRYHRRPNCASLLKHPRPMLNVDNHNSSGELLERLDEEDFGKWEM